MALSSTNSSGTTVAKTGSGAAEFYTVPTGKTFIGHLWNNSGTAYGYINGTRLYWPYSNSYFAMPLLPVTLSSGTVVAADNSGTTMLMGVEV